MLNELVKEFSKLINGRIEEKLVEVLKEQGFKGTVDDIELVREFANANGIKWELEYKKGLAKRIEINKNGVILADILIEQKITKIENGFKFTTDFKRLI